MLPCLPLIDSIGTLVAADLTTFGDAAFLSVFLIKAPFTPGPTLVLADVVPADGGGLHAIFSTVAGGNVVFNPQTNGQVVAVKVPLGGWHFVTTILGGLPQTMYGYGLIATTSGLLLATALLPAPMLMNAVGQFVDLPNVEIEFPIIPAF
jgi:hypothetical protein